MNSDRMASSRDSSNIESSSPRRSSLIHNEDGDGDGDDEREAGHVLSPSHPKRIGPIRRITQA